MKNNINRKKRAKRINHILSKNFDYKLKVYKTNRNIYINLIQNNRVIMSCSTVSLFIRKNILKKDILNGNIVEATLIANYFAKKCLQNDIKKLFFDRSGYKYHGRIKSVAEEFRLCGYKF